MLRGPQSVACAAFHYCLDRIKSHVQPFILLRPQQVTVQFLCHLVAGLVGLGWAAALACVNTIDTLMMNQHFNILFRIALQLKVGA